MTKIKLHKNLIEAVEETLLSIFKDGKLADKEVPKLLKNKQYGSRDRAFLAETCYDIVRWKLKYDYYAEQFQANKYQVKTIILISLLNRNYDIENLSIFGFLNDETEQLKLIIQQDIPSEAIQNSYSNEFYDFALNNIGNEWHSIAKTLNQKSKTYIRINTSKTSISKFSEILHKENIHFKPISSLDFLPNETFNAFEIISKNNLANSVYFKQRFFNFQDIGSQCIGHFIHTIAKQKTKIKILDMCAGLGGKTMHLADLFKNKATIYATEFDDKRYHILKNNLKDLQNCQCIPFQSINDFQYDIILIDAPCSGSGTIKRQPDLKYRITEIYILEKINIQAELLEKSKMMLNKNGVLIYATCSVLPAENEQQIQKFLLQNKDYNVQAQHTLSPIQYNSDGFYMCAINKNS